MIVEVRGCLLNVTGIAQAGEGGVSLLVGIQTTHGCRA